MPDPNDYAEPADFGYYRGWPDFITREDIAYDAAIDATLP